MRKITPIVIGVVLVCFTTWWNATSIRFIQLFNERIDHIAYDLQLKSKLFFPHSPSKNIVIVDIDDKSLMAEGHWPWPRDKIIQLTNKLNAMNVTAIAFDVIFSEKLDSSAENVMRALKGNSEFANNCARIIQNNITLFDQDTLFAQCIANGRIFLSYAFLQKDLKQNNLPPPLITLTSLEFHDLDLNRAVGYISSLPILQQAAKGSGFVNVEPDSDGIIRRIPMIMQYENKIYPSLSLEAISTIFGDKIELVTESYGDEISLEGIKIGQTIIPVNQKGETLIPFIGGSRTFKYLSATDILNNRISENELVGKIVLIGTSAIGLGDLQTTAIQAPYPGVEIHATIMESILGNRFISSPEWSRTASLSMILFCGLLATFLFPYLGPRLLGLLSVFTPISIISINAYLLEKLHIAFSISGVIFAIIIIAIMNTLYGYFFESKRREKIRMMFGQYLDEKHIEELINAKEGDVVLQSRDKEMSVLFADIRNFTTISEKMTAAELVVMLNTYLTDITTIIINHHGTIDKYVGDMVMAFWGAPLHDDHHASNAIKTALLMQKQTKILSESSSIVGIKGMKIGVGINSGIMSVGDMGSQYRRNYTVLGDSVNLASRLEGLSKFYGVGVIVSETTMAGQTEFLFRKLDKVQVKGKNVGVSIYEPVCLLIEETAQLKSEVDLSNQAVDLYFSQKWDESIVIFEKLHRQYPENIFYKLYLGRNSTMKLNPPPDDWDGVYVSLNK